SATWATRSWSSSTMKTRCGPPITCRPRDTMRAADHVVDFGPGPGVRGGEVVASGPVDKVCAEPRSLTGQYLSGQMKIAIPEKRRPIGEARLTVVGAAENNLKTIDAEIPLGVFVCVTGV